MSERARHASVYDCHVNAQFPRASVYGHRVNAREAGRMPALPGNAYARYESAHVHGASASAHRANVYVRRRSVYARHASTHVRRVNEYVHRVNEYVHRASACVHHPNEYVRDESVHRAGVNVRELE